MQDNIDSTKSIHDPAVAVNPDALVQSLQHTLTNNAQIDELTNTIAALKELVQQLRDEIALLKGKKPKPKIQPSQLEGSKKKKKWHKRFQRSFKQGKSILFDLWATPSLKVVGDMPSQMPCFKPIANAIRPLQLRSLEISGLAELVIKKIRRVGKPGQPKGKPRKKKTMLPIHAKPIIQPACIPEGAVFKGYKPYTVQDIIFQPHNTQYQIAQWMLPDGSYLTGELPKGIEGHYGPELIAYILHQYHACRVTAPLLLAQLTDKGVLISSGQLNNILVANKDSFHQEVAELLPAGVKADEQIQVDDTSGRHQGNNQYTTVIGNQWFSVFTTTNSKSRVNFLKLLQGGKDHYLINEDTVNYLEQVKVADYLPGYIAQRCGAKFTTREAWEQFLNEQNITQENERRFLTEAALFASLFTHGIPRDLSIHSDDAGQFDVVLFFNTLCWIHEERHYRKLVMTNDQARADLERVKGQIWVIYNDLKAYKQAPSEEAKIALKKQFDDIFQQDTCSPTLNHQLKKTYQKKEALLGVLVRIDTLLHNNASETDARAAKTKLKVSGGTRSDQGKAARDTFLSLKQTCRKLGINFLDFLKDRARGLCAIPRLAEIIRQRSLTTATDPPS
jgi:hypothetical protein